MKLCEISNMFCILFLGISYRNLKHNVRQYYVKSWLSHYIIMIKQKITGLPAKEMITPRDINSRYGLQTVLFFLFLLFWKNVLENLSLCYIFFAFFFIDKLGIVYFLE